MKVDFVCASSCVRSDVTYRLPRVTIESECIVSFVPKRNKIGRATCNGSLRHAVGISNCLAYVAGPSYGTDHRGDQLVQTAYRRGIDHGIY